MINRSVKPSLAMLAAVLCSGEGWAAGPQFHGYGSLAWIDSPDNAYFDDTPGDHFNYREAALNGSWQIAPSWRIAGQVLYRDAGAFTDDKTRVDFLLLDYNFRLTEHESIGVRLGRVKNEYGLYNVVRDVPHGHPGVFVPQSVYFEAFRDALLAVDGGSLYGRFDTPLGGLGVDLFKGTGRIENPTAEYQLAQVDGPGEFDEVDEQGLRLILAPDALPGLALAYSVVDASMSLENVPDLSVQQLQAGMMTLANDPRDYGDYITSAQIDALLQLLSVQYSWHHWILSAEYLQIRNRLSDFSVLNNYQPDTSVTSEGYYLQLEWLAGESVSVYGRYEELYYNRDDKDGSGFYQRTGCNPYTQYNRALTLGGRWFMTSDLALTAEYSRNQGAAFLNGQAGVDFEDLQEDWDAFIVQLSFHF
ncbi:hypothetical protein [Pseudomaricurvus sp. HS19]|uniref:hypothetical protein n=1 Tax=Pseudomaricurvus sp. HS19 TaxID=2692626 RepID=UPI00136C58EB|nr:hypothetical protein [Pseudomaricurvus sp. HS19]MYM63624.1 hypothetical protein [Pseudomaricurvus sp. HS19]